MVKLEYFVFLRGEGIIVGVERKFSLNLTRSFYDPLDFSTQPKGDIKCSFVFLNFFSMRIF
jgi:hypothetical protein